MPDLGAKFDGGKLCFSLLTRGLAAPLRSVAAVLTYGKAKYSADSWKTVPDAKRRYEDALDRHLNDWKDVNASNHDDESGLHHLAHAACNIFFLMWFEMNRKLSIGEQRDNWFKPNDPSRSGTVTGRSSGTTINDSNTPKHAKTVYEEGSNE